MFRIVLVLGILVGPFLPISAFAAQTSSFSSVFSDVISRFSQYFTHQQAAPANKTSPHAGAGGGGGAPGLSAELHFGGHVLPLPTPPTLCDDGSTFSYIGPPRPLPVMFTAGSVAYLYGPPLIVGQNVVGNAKPVSIPCYVGISLIGSGFPISINGSSSIGAPSGGGGGGQKPATPPSSKNVCQSATNDQYTQNALQQYGGNLMSGNVAGLEQFCPNFQTLSPSQRTGFWTQFVGAVEKPESDCNPTSILKEANGQLSQGLLQLSYGDQAKGAPGACKFAGGILDPQSNITCGVAIMNGLAPNGITNGHKGMDAYWSTLRSGHSSLLTIDAVMSAYPGCH